jgi:four helix bundle protein
MKKFNFEELDIWQRAVDFADEVIDVAEKLNSPRQHYRLIEQLEAAATSVALNIAEGKGRYSKKEFIQYLYIARGSLFETVTLLKIFEKRDWVDKIRLDSLSNNASELAKMLNGFISAIKKSLV